MKFELGKKRYNDYPTFFKTLFEERVQKLSIDGGFTCPNRDGSKGVGGCSFCNNESLTPIIVERCGELRNRSMKVSVFLPGSIRDKDIWLIFRRIRTRMRR